MTTIRNLGSIVFTVLLVGHAADGYPGGPPTSACSDMTPSHGVAASTEEPKYAFEVNPVCYTAGKSLNVTLKSTENVIKFRGFFVQARTSVDNENSHGTFTILDNNPTQLINCFSKQNNAVGHKSAVDKSSVTFQWTPADGASSNYTFVATVVQKQRTFWVKAVTYEVAQCGESTESTSTPTESTSTPTSTPSTTRKEPDSGDSGSCVVSPKESWAILSIATLLAIVTLRSGTF